MKTHFSDRATRYMSTLATTLDQRGDTLGHALLTSIIARGRQNPDLAEAIETYCAAPGTLTLKTLIAAFEPPPSPKIKDQLDAHNAFTQIDAAQIVAEFRVENRTGRTLEGRLFPAEEFGHGWSLSLQGDLAGYACAPRARLDHLEDYETLEGVIYGPDETPVSIAYLGLPKHTSEKFDLTHEGGVWVGANLTWDDINEIRIAIACEVDRLSYLENSQASGSPHDAPEV